MRIKLKDHCLAVKELEWKYNPKDKSWTARGLRHVYRITKWVSPINVLWYQMSRDGSSMHSNSYPDGLERAMAEAVKDIQSVIENALEVKEYKSNE